MACLCGKFNSCPGPQRGGGCPQYCGHCGGLVKWIHCDDGSVIHWHVVAGDLGFQYCNKALDVLHALESGQ